MRRVSASSKSDCSHFSISLKAGEKLSFLVVNVLLLFATVLLPARFEFSYFFFLTCFQFIWPCWAHLWCVWYGKRNLQSRTLERELISGLVCSIYRSYSLLHKKWMRWTQQAEQISWRTCNKIKIKNAKGSKQEPQSPITHVKYRHDTLMLRCTYNGIVLQEKREETATSRSWHLLTTRLSEKFYESTTQRYDNTPAPPSHPPTRRPTVVPVLRALPHDRLRYYVRYSSSTVYR